MSTETLTDDAPEMGTKPTPHHDLFQRFIGEWRTRSEMFMGPDQPAVTAEGTETVTSLGGLFAHIHGRGQMPNGKEMQYFCALGYDVSFNEYRGVWYADVSSHIWVYKGVLSEDGNRLTLNCEGPNMDPTSDALTASYKDEYEFLDANTRTLTSYGLQPDGTWAQFMKCTITRA